MLVSHIDIRNILCNMKNVRDIDVDILWEEKLTTQYAK